MNDTYEGEIGALFGELADVQSSLLAVLTEKRALLITGDVDALRAIATREEELAARLQSWIALHTSW